MELMFKLQLTFIFIFFKKRLSYMSDNFPFVTLHGFLLHWLGTASVLFFFPPQTKVQYYRDASDWFSCQVQNCSAPYHSPTS